jgi:hypothetical protein
VEVGEPDDAKIDEMRVSDSIAARLDQVRVSSVHCITLYRHGAGRPVFTL